MITPRYRGNNILHPPITEGPPPTKQPLYPCFNRSRGVAVRRSSSYIDFGHNMRAGPKLQITVLPFLQDDLHRETLHNPDGVSRRISRWERAEHLTDWSDAVHVTPVGPAGSIDVTLCPKSRANEAELCLFEDSSDPDILQMNNRQQLLPRLNV